VGSGPCPGGYLLTPCRSVLLHRRRERASGSDVSGRAGVGRRWSGCGLGWAGGCFGCLFIEALGKRVLRSATSTYRAGYDACRYSVDSVRHPSRSGNFLPSVFRSFKIIPRYTIQVGGLFRERRGPGDGSAPPAPIMPILALPPYPGVLPPVWVTSSFVCALLCAGVLVRRRLFFRRRVTSEAAPLPLIPIPAEL